MINICTFTDCIKLKHQSILKLQLFRKFSTEKLYKLAKKQKSGIILINMKQKNNSLENNNFIVYDALHNFFLKFKKKVKLKLIVSV